MKSFVTMLFLFALSFNLLAQSADPSTAIDGTYHLLTPERSPKGGTTNQMIMQFAERNGTKMLVTAACSNCTPAVYTYQPEPSQALGLSIFFNSFGIYMIQYDANSFVSVMPDKQFGKGVFEKIAYSNFYSKNQSKAAGMTTAKISEYAIGKSKQMMQPSTSTEAKTWGTAKYNVAVSMTHMGKKYDVYDVEFVKSPMRKIVTSPAGAGCCATTYLYLREYSKLIGIDVYGNHLEEYLYLDKPGDIIYAKQKSGLGKSVWSANDNFNIYSKDKQMVRNLLINKAAQDAYDAKLTEWTRKIKAHEDKKRSQNEAASIEKQRLPKQGLKNATLEAQALQAAKNWASKYGWKETITDAYFTSADWIIRRNPLTGIQTGREIRGTIVMKRPDGLCSFHHAVFAQQYSDGTYRKVYTDGIVPGQKKLKCENAKR